MSEKKVVTRFAPSPTGFMHIGGVRTALYDFLWARKNKGTFILRIEDTDKEREVEGSKAHIMESLRWIGISWNEGPDIGGPHASYIQSERLPLYIKYAEQLIEKGFAYPDPYTKDELDTFRKQAESEKRAFLYREHRPENFGVWDGTKALRFKTPEIKSYKWTDAARGELSAGPEALDDFILVKADGYPTYNFAHIIDDMDMGVTHVMRADEFISSTPKFLSLYDALGITPPIFVTLPPILTDGGNKKLGKRDGAKDILDYRDEGYLPEAMMNFLALLGWNPGTEKEVFSTEELVNAFEIGRIQISGAQVNLEKLDWMNKEHMKKLSNEEFVRQAKLFIHPEILRLKNLNETELNNYILLFRDRIVRFGELNDLMTDLVVSENGLVTLVNDYLLPAKDPAIFKLDLLIPKDLQGKEDTLISYMTEVKSIIEKNDWDKVLQKNDENKLWVYSGEIGRGKVLLPVRVALSGREKSQDLFDIMKAIGKESTLRRIDNAIKRLGIKEKELNTETRNNIPTVSDTFTLNK